MTVMDEWSLPAILLTQDLLVVFSLPCSAEEGRHRAVSSQSQPTTPSTAKFAICFSLLIHPSQVTTKTQFCFVLLQKQILMILWKPHKHNRHVWYKTTACKAIKNPLVYYRFVPQHCSSIIQDGPNRIIASIWVICWGFSQFLFYRVYWKLL